MPDGNDLGGLKKKKFKCFVWGFIASIFKEGLTQALIADKIQSY